MLIIIRTETISPLIIVVACTCIVHYTNSLSRYYTSCAINYLLILSCFTGHCLLSRRNRLLHQNIQTASSAVPRTIGASHVHRRLGREVRLLGLGFYNKLVQDNSSINQSKFRLRPDDLARLLFGYNLLTCYPNLNEDLNFTGRRMYNSYLVGTVLVIRKKHCPYIFYSFKKNVAVRVWRSMVSFLG